MDVTLEKTSELEGFIVVKVAEADYADRVKKELKEIGATRQIPGFRKGHIDMTSSANASATKLRLTSSMKFRPTHASNTSKTTSSTSSASLFPQNTKLSTSKPKNIPSNMKSVSLPS